MSISNTATDKIEEVRGSVLSIEQRLLNLDTEWPKLERNSVVSNSCESAVAVEEGQFETKLSQTDQRTQKDEVRGRLKLRALHKLAKIEMVNTLL